MSTPMPDSVRKALLEAPETGLLRVPYSTGQALKRRGLAEEYGDRVETGRSFPLMRLRLTEEGRKVSHDLRELEIYRATRESIEREFPKILEMIEPFQAAAEQHKLVERLEASGMSSAGPRAYRDVLQAYCQELVV